MRPASPDASLRLQSGTDHRFQELDAFNQRMVEVFRQAPAFMCVLKGADHKFELINDRYMQLVGNRQDLIGLPVILALPEIAGQGFIELLDKVYESGETFVGIDMPVLLQRTPDTLAEQRFIDLTCSAFRDADGTIAGVLAHGIDQTERKAAELALRSSEERYRALLTTLDEGFCIIDMLFDDAGQALDYRFVEVNPAFEKHSGLPNSVGTTIRQLVPTFEQRFLDFYADVLRTGTPDRYAEYFASMDRWFDVHASRVGEAGSTRVAIIFNDISERKKGEESLRRLAADLSEADRRKSEFLATLAHELRNPLAPIRSGLSVLRLSANNPAVLPKIIEMMDRQVSNMVHLIDDLLDIARISGGKVELRKDRVELKQLVASAIETSLPGIETGKHELVVDLPDAPLLLDADATRIAQIFSNLLNNAAKYTPAGGRIALSARQQGAKVMVAVRDNGIGIPAESMGDIFGMFNQVGRNMAHAQGGLGIGLCLVRRLVEMHGGTVEAASAGVGQGSTFSVTLPLAAWSTDSVHALVPPAQAGEVQGRFKVLVVDDNVDAAETLSDLLALQGHAVAIAHDGLDGLRTAKTFEPDVVFLDIGMPGMNGYETALAIRQLAGMESVILVALSGWGTAGDRERSRAAGIEFHLTKPAQLVTLAELFTQIAALAHSPRSAF